MSEATPIPLDGFEIDHAAIDAGFVLADDRDEILADADPSRFGG